MELSSQTISRLKIIKREVAKQCKNEKGYARLVGTRGKIARRKNIGRYRSLNETDIRRMSFSSFFAEEGHE